MNWPSKQFRRALVMIGLVVLGAGVWGWRLERQLPYHSQTDEPIFTTVTVGMLQRHTLNPQWFGNPGSTLIYPLTGLFWLRQQGGVGDAVQQFFGAYPDYFILGRALTLAYALASIPLWYLVARKLFDDRVATLSTLALVCTPLLVAYMAVLRTDAPGLFFMALGLLTLLRYAEVPTTKRAFVLGIAIGLATATRFFLLPALVAGLVVNEWLNKQWRWRPLLVAALSAATTFVVTTPFLFIDYQTALRSLAFENRDESVGGDGFTRWGNLAWYLYAAIPGAITWPIWFAAVLGGVRAFFSASNARILVIVATSFLLFITLHALHWQRWLIPIVPILLLLAVSTMVELYTWARQRHAGLAVLFVGVLIALFGVQIGTVVLLHRAYGVVTPRYRALEWLQTDATVRADGLVCYQRSALWIHGALPQPTHVLEMHEDGFLEDFVAQPCDILVLNDELMVSYRTHIRAPVAQAVERLIAQDWKPAAHFTRLAPCPLPFEEVITPCTAANVTIYRRTTAPTADAH